MEKITPCNLSCSCFSFVLTVARYAFELTVNNLLNNLMKYVQDLMTDLGLFTDEFRINTKKTSRNKRSNWFQFSQLPYLGHVILRLLSSFLLIILQQQEQQ